MTFHWDDPHLVEKASAFFIAELRRARENQLAAANGKKTDAATDGDDGGWHLGLDNLPEELPPPQFLKLLKLRMGIQSVFDTLPPEANDGRLAARAYMFRRILLAAYFFIERLLLYLLFDTRFHPERKICARAIQVLRIGNDEAEDEDYYQKMKDLFVGTKLCMLIHELPKPNGGDIDNALTILRDTGNIFFMTLGSIFPLRVINKCNMSFSLFMDAIGVDTSIECVAKFVKHMKAMQRALEDWDAHGGTVAPNAREQALERQGVLLSQLSEKVQALQESQQSSAKTLANMDRRLRAFLKFLKRVLSGFIKLFQPKAPKPTREQVRDALLPPDRYACLDRVKEPHRSQIKAVIDHTRRHPIVHRQTRGDDYTLADAVRDTWRENAEKWSRVPGTFATVNDLKSACYNQQQDQNDPFYYQV